MRLDPETGNVVIATRDAGLSAATVTKTVVSDTKTETVIYESQDVTAGLALMPTIAPPINAPPGPNDIQAIVEDFQSITDEITSGSLPGPTESPGDISIPGPGQGGNDKPQRLRIPIIVIEDE
jgi:hypothetical protein